ncbi:MAG TPA: Xaa-Pro aminopeptidase [Pyrinomonadaceae bacterium]|nr:Xaa-Pro aminopeptidase [Pyrinomonadaceae bacterium]
MRRPQLAEFMRRMEENSVAVIASAPEAVRSNDTHYRYRQDSDFFYLTGLDEPDSIAVIRPGHGEHPYTLFVRPRDPERETWEGRRAGIEGARDVYGADAAFPVEEFGEKLGEMLDGARNVYYRLGVRADLDELLVKQIGAMRQRSRTQRAPDSITDPGALLSEMRLVKTDEEIELMQRAADIAAEAHVEAMRAARPGMYEYEIEALIEYVFRRRGAAGPAYTTIVGGGANATVLHYVTNDSILREGDLLLIDAGCEFRGYASDITRTFPVANRFTAAQREIYSVVLETQLACVEMVRPGVTMEDLNERAVSMLTDGMLRLGLLRGDAEKLVEEKEYRKFFMHGLGHFLGMDVHDVGRYRVDDGPRKLAPGNVITVEPGLYVPADAGDVPERFRGVGIRIEDDVLVTAEGRRVLTDKVPKQIEEIEGLTARGDE